MFHRWCMLNQQAVWLSRHHDMWTLMAKFIILFFLIGAMYVLDAL